MSLPFHRTIRALIAILLLALPAAAQACATCLGAPDAAMTKGLNWGIGSLLLVVLFVLGSIAAFFVYLIRRASMMARTAGETGEDMAYSEYEDSERDREERLATVSDNR